MRFSRHASADRIEVRPRARGATVTFQGDEVSRFAVRLVVIDRERDASYVTPFSRLPGLLRAGDLVVVNDAATLPAALWGTTSTGARFELRLSAPVDGSRLHGVMFGAGDHRTRTEHRDPPPEVATGDRVRIGPLDAIVEAKLGRRVVLATDARPDAVWQALYAHGRPVQYAHRPELMPLYVVQTAYAARPWAAEMPSAGRALTWDVLLGLRRAGVTIATLTHAAGLSSTGDDELDRAMPWPERYEIPQRTVDELARTKARGGRVIAIGTTVVRALEAAAAGGVRAGSGVATLRLDAQTTPKVVDGLVSGLHVPGESHFELLSAFAPAERLRSALELASAQGLSNHELGDACLIIGS